MRYTFEQRIINEYYRWLEKPENSQHRRWHDELLDVGFELEAVCPSNSDFEWSENAILKLIRFYYVGKFVVAGEYNENFFVLNAVFLPDDIAFYYTNSYINKIYLYKQGFDYVKEVQTASLNRLERFINNNRIYIEGLFCSIEMEIRNDEVFFYSITDNVSDAMGVFEKLAVLLDFQINRRFSFCNIREYESIYSDTITWDFLAYLASYTNVMSIVRDHFVGCSYAQSKEDVVRHIEEFMPKIPQDDEKGKKMLDALRNLLSELNEMSEEKFADLKDRIFDL